MVRLTKRNLSSPEDRPAKKICKVFNYFRIIAPTILVMTWMTNGRMGSVRSFQNETVGSSSSGIRAASKSAFNSYNVNDKCKNLSQIRPSGEFFLEDKVQNVESAEGITPSFHLGSYLGDKVKYHMADDKVHFELIKELFQKKHTKKNALALDMGANQGFFTFFLASLGLDVHGFEIERNNFASLMHGRYFNPKDVGDRVYLYPIGLDQKISRFGMQGGLYEGFLKDSENGPILGVTFDCFAYHTKLDLSNVAFVKLDVEGFEIAVLKGASQSLFKKGNNIGGMLMEVGPKRWTRAKIDFETGVEEMKKLALHFKDSYLILRGSESSGYAKTCPTSLVEEGVLTDANPRIMDTKIIYKVKADEWEGLLKKMEENDYDCNFWYAN